MSSYKLLYGVWILSILSCGKKEDDKSAKENTLADLKISGSLAITLPDAAKGKGARASLLVAEQSRHACIARNYMKSGLQIGAVVAQSFCYSEREPAIKKTGGKFEFKESNGTTYAVFVETPTSSTYKISFCQNGALTDVFSLDGSNAKGSKGSWKSIGSDTVGSWKIDAAFDGNYTKDAKQSLFIKEIYTDSKTKDVFRLGMAVGYDSSTKVTDLATVNTGTSGKEEFDITSRAKIGDKYGMSVNHFGAGKDSTGTAYSSQSDYAYFDAAGYVAASTATTDFDTGNALNVQTSQVPKTLGSSFDVTAFSGEWDCKGGQVVESEMTTEDAAACAAMYKDKDYEWEDCWTSSFADGTNIDPALSPAVDITAL